MADRRPRAATVWVGYTALRLLLFAVPFLVIWALSGNPTLAAVFAAVIGLCLSFVLLDRRRSAVGGLIAERVERRRPSTDESVEDRAVEGGAAGEDAQTDSAPASPRP